MAQDGAVGIIITSMSVLSPAVMTVAVQATTDTTVAATEHRALIQGVGKDIDGLDVRG